MADGNVEEEETDVTQEAAMHAGNADEADNCEAEAEVDSETKKPPKHVEIIMQVGFLTVLHTSKEPVGPLVE